MGLLCSKKESSIRIFNQKNALLHYFFLSVLVNQSYRKYFEIEFQIDI